MVITNIPDIPSLYAQSAIFSPSGDHAGQPLSYSEIEIFTMLLPSASIMYAWMVSHAEVKAILVPSEDQVGKALVQGAFVNLTWNTDQIRITCKTENIPFPFPALFPALSYSIFQSVSECQSELVSPNVV
jgi:hypothetical protein